MKIYNKFVESKKEPSNKNDIWFDGEVFNIYKEGKWQAFTFRISDAEAVIRIVREFVDYYNNDIKPTVQEAQEAAARIETYVSLAIEATETSTRNNELFVKLNAQLAELFSELQSLIDASNIAISSAQEAASLASSQAKLTQQATQETIEATANANNAINTINILVETLEETINNKVDKIPGKGLSTNDFTDEDKGKLAELSNKVNTLLQSDEFDKDGNYPLLHVGTADDLAGRGESVPAEFGFRASGGKSIKDGRAYIKRIKGNSVVWNQTINFAPSTQTINGVTYTINNDGTITMSGVASDSSYVELLANNFFMGGHKYALTGGFTSGNSLSTYFLAINKGGSYTDIASPSVIFTADIDKINKLFVRIASGVNTNGFKVYPKIYDLTKMFGAGNEPTKIEEFYARVATLGVDMNAYNEGQVIHCNTESIKSVGDNAWDEEWELGLIDYNNGELKNSAKNVRSKNFIKVLPNATYNITSPQKLTVCQYDASKNYIGYVGGQTLFTTNNAHYIRFYTYEAYGTTYNHDICIRLAHTGYKTDYEPYWQDTLPLPIIRKYFPDGMKKAGSAHDEIRYNKASGKWEYSKGRIKSVDLGSVSKMNYNSSLGAFYFTLIDMRIPTTDAERVTGLICSRYNASNNAAVADMPDKTMLRFPGGYIYIKDSSYTDAASFKAAMQGVILYYESNDWEWVELDAEDQNFRDYYNVADFGTEEAIPATDAEGNIIPSAAFSADIIYQFNAVDMIREHEIEINDLQNVIATMQAQLASLIN